MLKPVSLAQINRILFFAILISIIMYFGRNLLVLITFSGFLAMLMTPVSNGLENIRFPRILSSLVSVFIIIIVISGVLLLLSSQIANISQDLSQIKTRLEEILSNSQEWINRHIGISSEDQKSTIKDQLSEAMSTAGSYLAGMVKGTFTLIGSFILVLVFTFLFLLHREKYENFVVMLYKGERRNEAKEMIVKISKIAQQYLAGRLISILILAVLYLAGFSIIGLKNAALLSAIAAIMTFIPYVGPVIGGLVPFLMAILSGSLNQAFWVAVIILLAQAFDNYFIEPYIVGGSVRISPFFSIFILILGGVVWGIAGILLFLPLLGILKIVFENVEGLEPYAYLIGDQRDSVASKKMWIKLKGFFSGKR